MLFRYNTRLKRFEVLLGKRALRKGFGQWSIIGGGMESGDSGYEACAFREFCEETGVDLKRLFSKKIAVRHIDAPFFHWRTYMVLSWGYFPDFRPDRENSEFGWFPIQTVHRQNLWISLNGELRAFCHLVRKHALVIAYHTGMPFKDEKLLAAYRILPQIKYRTRDTVTARILKELPVDRDEAARLARRLRRYYVESAI